MDHNNNTNNNIINNNNLNSSNWNMFDLQQTNNNWFFQFPNDQLQNNNMIPNMQNNNFNFTSIPPLFYNNNILPPDQNLSFGTGFVQPGPQGPQTHMGAGAPMLTTDHQFQFQFQPAHIENGMGSSGLPNFDPNLIVLDDQFDDATFDTTGLNLDELLGDQDVIKIDDDEPVAPATGNNNVPGPSSGRGGRRKRKASGSPARNLEAERRRRAKLNARLFNLRSTVPVITKMDRASTLKDAITYIKDLLEKINKLNVELDAAPSSSLMPPPAALAVTATATAAFTAPPCIGEEIPPRPTRIEVGRRGEGRVVIHLASSRKPGLMLSITRTMDDLGLEIQSAVAGGLDGLVLDVHEAKKTKDVHEDEIKVRLFEAVRSHGAVQNVSG